MTIENCKRLLKHYEDEGMDEAATNMKFNLLKRGGAKKEFKKTDEVKK